MNKERRKELVRIAEMVYDAKVALVRVQDKEQEAYDNLPEGIQSSDKGSDMEDKINELEEAIDYLETVFDILDQMGNE